MTDNEIVGEQENNLTFAVSRQLVETMQEPTFIYETTRKLASKFEAEKQRYIVTQSQKLGINPNIVIEQQQFIGKLKAELTEVRAESKKRESALQDVLALHKGIKSDEDDDFFSSCTCDEWDEYNNGYPCPTRQAIINRIGGK